MIPLITQTHKCQRALFAWEYHSSGLVQRRKAIVCGFLIHNITVSFSYHSLCYSFCSNRTGLFAVPPTCQTCVKHPSTSCSTYTVSCWLTVYNVVCPEIPYFTPSLLKWHTHWPPIAAPPTATIHWVLILIHFAYALTTACNFTYVSASCLSSFSPLGYRLHESRDLI